MLCFFFRHNFNRLLCMNIFFMSSHSRPLSLVCAPPQLKLFPSPATFHMFPFLSASPSNLAPFCVVDNSQSFQRHIYIFLNPCWIRCSHFRFPCTLLSYGNFLWCRETVAHIPALLLGSLPIYHKTSQDTMKTKLCKMSLLRILSKGINLGLLPTGRPA